MIEIDIEELARTFHDKLILLIPGVKIAYIYSDLQAIIDSSPTLAIRIK